MHTSPALAAFVDLSSIDTPARPGVVSTLARHDRLGGVVTRAVVLGTGEHATTLPGGWSDAGDAPPEQALAWAFDAAADVEQSLLIVAAGATPTAESIWALVESLDLDPLFGIAIPRLGDVDSGRLTLPRDSGPSAATAPLRMLASVPDYQVTTEHTAPCMLIRRELVGNLGFAAVPGMGVWALLLDYAIRARRAGHRPVQCNRVVVDLGRGPSAAAWGCSEEDAAAVYRRYPEVTPPPSARLTHAERLLAASIDEPRSLLIDARNLTPIANGTSVAILGAADALHRARPDRSVALWLHPDASDWYRATDRYPAWTICTTTPDQPRAASLRLSQPWHAAELDVLSASAAVNVYWILDTIAWDIGYAAPPGLDATWQRLASDADGLLFISDFSRRRFTNRFTCAPGVRVDSCLLSLDPTDYATPVAENGPAPPYWLVVGNRYDHKHVAPTVDLLARSFPSRSLVVFGDRDQARATRVVRFDSGAVDDQLIRACYARADVVIFPSFYEGFGLPVVEGLSYGRTVVVRESALVTEIAERYRGPGRLIVYSTERELVDVLGQIDRDDAPAGVPLGTRAGVDAWNWDAAAVCMLEAVDDLVAAAPSPQMLARTGLARGLWATK